MGENILYRLHKECEFETLETNDNYINSIFKNAEKYYSFPDTINGIEIKQMLPLGNFAFYILNCENLDFDKDILSKLKLINEFLSKCIINKELCNNKVFLAFIRDILKMQKFPQGNIYVSNYYTKTDNVNLDMENKLKLMLNNIKNIEVTKDYICTDIIDLIVVSIFEVFSHGFFIRKCRNCYKYFLNKNSNKYCPYASYQNSHKSCYDYCTNASYIEKRKTNPIRNKYNKISNMLRNRYEYYGNRSDRDILDDFCEKYQDKMEKLKKGIIPESEVLKFLDLSDKNFKEEYKRRKKDGGKGDNKK